MDDDARLRSGVLGQVLTLPVSLVFVALWSEPEGFFFVGLAVISLYAAPYLVVALWLAYRVCGLGLGWLAGIGCALAYPMVSAVGFFCPWFDTSTGTVAWVTASCSVIVPAGIVTLTSRSAPPTGLPLTAWPRVALGLLGVPVTAIALFLAYDVAFAMA